MMVAAKGVLQHPPLACIVRHAPRHQDGGGAILKAGTRMTRRDFIVLAGTLPIAWPVVARGQGKARAIGFLHSGTSQFNSGVVDAFRQGLKETGFTDKNLKIEFRWAEDHNDRLPDLAADLVHRNVDVIAANSVATIAARAATPTIPIVFQSGVDPVASGLVASLGHPGGRTTGVSFFGSTLEVKKLEVLHELMPAEAVIAVLVNPDNPQEANQANELQAAAALLRRPVAVYEAGTEHDIENAFAALTAAGDKALVVVGDPFFNSRRRQLIALAARLAIPTIYSNRENVDEGGLISYGASLPEAYREVGLYTGRILKGAKPADLPVLQPTKFEMVINLKAARALELALPPALLDRADKVIE
jgi:putative ABC transport system substrate-binding protein